MIIDPIRPATNFGIWEVTCEYTNMENNSPIDFAPYENIQVEMEDPFSGAIVMVLTRGGGQITTPTPGIIEWRVGRSAMSALMEGTYHVRMEVWHDDRDAAVALMDSSVSIVGS